MCSASTQGLAAAATARMPPHQPVPIMPRLICLTIVRQINLGIIGTGWCGGIRAVAAAASPWVDALHIAEIKEERLKEVAELTGPVTATTDYRKLVQDP